MLSRRAILGLLVIGCVHPHEPSPPRAAFFCSEIATLGDSHMGSVCARDADACEAATTDAILTTKKPRIFDGSIDDTMLKATECTPSMTATCAASDAGERCFATADDCHQAVSDPGACKALSR